MKGYWLLIFFVLVKILSISAYPVVLWDESVYVGMGKYVWSSGESGLFEPFRPMFFPLLLGVLWKLGFSVYLYKIFMVIVTGLLIYFTHRVSGHYLEQKEFGYLLLFSPLLFHMADSIMTSIVCALFGMIALDRYHAKQYGLVGVMLGIAFGIRYPAGILMAAFFFGLIYMRKWGSLAKICLGFLLVFMIYLGFATYVDVGMGNILEAVEHASNVAHGVDGNLWNLFFYPAQLVIDNIMMLLLIPGIWLMWKDKKILLLILALLPILYFTSIINKQPRFMLMFMPFMSIIAARGLEWIIARKDRLYRVLVVFLLGVMVCTTVIADGWHYTYHPKEQRDIESFYRYFEDKDGIVMTTDPIPSAYSDNKFIPIYFSYRSIEELYDEGIDESDYIMWTKAGYACDSYGKQCEINVDEINQLVQENTNIFNESYSGHEHSIFSVDRR